MNFVRDVEIAVVLNHTEGGLMMDDVSISDRSGVAEENWMSNLDCGCLSSEDLEFLDGRTSFVLPVTGLLDESSGIFSDGILDSFIGIGSAGVSELYPEAVFVSDVLSSHSFNAIIHRK